METLQYGRHIGNGAIFGPNPNLLPEVSKKLEAGVNLKFDNVFFDGDGFRAKAAIYENKVDNFITTAIGRYPQAGTFGDLVQTAFVHVNLLGPTTTMKGFELEASYDAGKAYIGASYTRLNTTYDGVYDPFFAGPPIGNCLSAVSCRNGSVNTSSSSCRRRRNTRWTEAFASSIASSRWAAA